MIGWIRRRLGAPFRALSRQVSEELAATRGAVAGDIAGVRASLASLRREHADQIGDLSRQLAATREEIAGLREQVHRPAPDATQRFYDGLNAIGVLNWQDDIVSGERRFLERFAARFAKPMVFDVGANIGGYVRLLREVMPQATIHAFEPNPPAFVKLERAAEETGATAHALALGDAPGEIELFDYADETGSQHASIFREVIEGIHKRPAVGATVRCETLDRVAEQLGVDHIHLLKVDVEGNELAVFKGAARLLAERRIDVIQFEFNEMAVSSRVYFKDFFELLEGFSLYRLLQDGVVPLSSYDPRTMEIFAFQNIACIRDDLAQDWIV